MLYVINYFVYIILVKIIVYNILIYIVDITKHIKNEKTLSF